MLRTLTEKRRRTPFDAPVVGGQGYGLHAGAGRSQRHPGVIAADAGAFAAAIVRPRSAAAATSQARS